MFIKFNETVLLSYMSMTDLILFKQATYNKLNCSTINIHSLPSQIDLITPQLSYHHKYEPQTISRGPYL